MRHRVFIGYALCWALFSAVGVHAQNKENQTPANTLAATEFDVASHVDLPTAIAEQRKALSLQRDTVMATYEKQQKICWQKFAVNACLIEARRFRRQGLDPIQQQDLALNAQEREWRTEQRTIRLQGKQAPAKDTP